ncbi:endo-1,4-beta-xylanase [Glycomyces xiaoerkulensis]|uniref:endo-1,4-beta-xylanase n=1 Tax=Glycomyces xiaoerkulensis TaxID=2038139 RepID=UPI0012FFEB62|nr:endo-1,4-beta-xylanase [Glycomyces xiaoerkulensis]
MSTQFATAQQSTLRSAADSLGIDIGVAVDDNLLQNDSTYRNVISEQFNSVTAENGMKMETVQPSQGNFDFSQGDRLVQFAQQNNMSVHGHTLVWHSQSPNWVQNLSGAEMEQAMVDHITTTMNHFEGDVDSWDVANEVVENGQLRNSFWLQGIGSDYIETAYSAARQADPGADLYLNDYSIDGINSKSDRYYQLAQDLTSQGLLDGMGFQAHLILGQVPGDMEQNLQRFADLGLDVRVTELDVRIDMPASQQELQQQADDFERVVNICTNIADCSGVTVWGLRDGDSWVPDTFDGQGAPLLYNDDYSTKPAYDAVLAALGGSQPPPPTETTEPPGTTEPPPPSGDCSAVIEVVNDWGSGWQANVSVTGPTDGWTLSWNWPGSQGISSSWNADITESGSSVTASDVGWNGSIASGQTQQVFGFIGSGPAVEPSVTCSAG